MGRLGIHIALIAVTSLVLIARVCAQDDGTKSRLAQAYEQAGDHERAVQIYEELFAKDSLNFVLFDGLRRGYLNLKRYDDAIMLIERRIVTSGRDINLAAMLGEAQYRAGDEERAFATWEDALTIDAKNPQAYRFIANYITQNRLFERAIDVYVRGREKCGDPSLFVVELAMLHVIMMNYKQATREYLGILYKNPEQLNYAESRIAMYTGKPEGLSAALAVVQEELKVKRDVVWLWHLLAWLHLEGKQFDQAYAVYRTIDKLSNAGGKELFSFADRAFRERAYLVSYRAFREILETYPVYERRLYAQYGLARSVEELSRLLADSIRNPVSLQFLQGEPRPNFQVAIDLYAEIAAVQPRSHLAAQSLLQIGVLRFERLFDLDGALEALEKGEHAAPGTPTSFETGVMVGEVWIAKGDLEKAEGKWNRLVSTAALPPGLQQRLKFKLAELDYYRGNFDDASTKLEGFMQDPLLDFTNDALLLRTLIQENRTPSEDALKLYARSEFLVKQRKYSEAIELFRQILSGYSSSFLRDEALMKVAVLQTTMENYGDAIASYERVLADFADDSEGLDRAQMAIAEIYHFYLRDVRRAIEAYQTLLEQSPNSIYSAQARKRIRQLRGDSI